jgi:hypothetical protein
LEAQDDIMERVIQLALRPDSPPIPDQAVGFELIETTVTFHEKSCTAPVDIALSGQQIIDLARYGQEIPGNWKLGSITPPTSREPRIINAVLT